MKPRAKFYPKPETNFTGFNTADLRLSLTYKIVLWSLKGECMVYGRYAMANALHKWKMVPAIQFLKSVYS